MSAASTASAAPAPSNRRRAGARLPDARGADRRLRRPHRGGPRAVAGPARHSASGVQAQPRAAMRLLHRRHPDVARLLPARTPAPDEDEIRDLLERPSVPLHRLYADRARGARSRGGTGGRHRAERNQMLDLGTSFVASVARDPDALAIVDGGVRLTYAQWYARISSLVAAFDRTRPETRRPSRHRAAKPRAAATLHWACQFAGIVITPINWRVKADELDFCIENSEAARRRLPGRFRSSRRRVEARAGSAAHLRRAAVDDGRRIRIRSRMIADASAATRRRASAPKPGRSCSTRPAPRRGRRACRGVTAPSAPPASPMSRKTFTGAASARSA